jgi:hypothetical protein
VRCESVGADGLWLEQPSARGGLLVTYIDISGTAARRIPISALRQDDELAVLHATSTSAGSIVRSVRTEAGAIVIDADAEAFGLVLHLPGAAS